MWRATSAWVWLVSCLTALGTAAPLRAEGAAGADSDSAAAYRVPPECPDRESWHAALRARLLEALPAEHLAQRLTIEIRRLEDGAAPYVGALAAQAGAEAWEAREVRGATCAEVMEALSLIATLGAGPATAQPRDGEPVATVSAWDLTPAEELRLLDEDRAPAAPAPPVAPRRALGVTTFALLETTAAPRIGLNYGIGASLGWRMEAIDPWLFAGIYRGTSERISVPGSAAAARVARWSTYVVGCPLRWALHAAVNVRPCLDLDLGQVTGEGLDVGSARRRHALLASTGLELRLEWSPFPALELTGMFGGVVPLARPRFYFRPQLTAFEVAPVGLRAGALASLLF